MLREKCNGLKVRFPKGFILCQKPPLIIINPHLYVLIYPLTQPRETCGNEKYNSTASEGEFAVLCTPRGRGRGAVSQETG